MEKSIKELKVQAKKLLKNCKRSAPNSVRRVMTCYSKTSMSVDDVQLKHCQYALAKEYGFHDWHELLLVLQEEAKTPGSNMGTIFYNSASGAFTNRWFTDYGSAKAQLDETNYLLPHKNQFLLVSTEYLAALGIDDINSIDKLGRDLVESYPSSQWDKVVANLLRLNSPPETHKTNLDH